MTEQRLLDERRRPRFDLSYYAVSKDGRYGSASLYQGGQFAVADAKGARLEQSAYLFKSDERPKGPVSGVLPKR
jgi:N4-(beta-N-acetylglucosaminyl)-L-asparaginase